ncbi:MAG: GNAT family N-acetyltransferase [Bacteroidales bacterium]|nr:GNAT family N-acetyltransferase [Bacteroidales bacterium]
MQSSCQTGLYYTMNTIKIDLSGKAFLIEICHNKNELPEIKKLDDLVFSKHQGISTELLQAIFEQGGLLVYKINNQIVAESQVLFESAAGQKIENRETALFYGTAVLAEFRGQHIGEALAMAQKKVAVTKGKSLAMLSVRPENAASISLRMKLGFVIKSWQADYYGSGRLILEKDLATQAVSHSRAPGKVVKSILLKIGDQPDEYARAQIAACFQSNLKPVAYHIINAAEAVLDFSE